LFLERNQRGMDRKLTCDLDAKMQGTLPRCESDTDSTKGGGSDTFLSNQKPTRFKSILLYYIMGVLCLSLRRFLAGERNPLQIWGETGVPMNFLKILNGGLIGSRASSGK